MFQFYRRVRKSGKKRRNLNFRALVERCTTRSTTAYVASQLRGKDAPYYYNGVSSFTFAWAMNLYYIVNDNKIKVHTSCILTDWLQKNWTQISLKSFNHAKLYLLTNLIIGVADPAKLLAASALDQVHFARHQKRRWLPPAPKDKSETRHYWKKIVVVGLKRMTSLYCGK